MSEGRLYGYVRQKAMINELIRIGPVKLKDEPLLRGKVIIKRGKLTVSVSDVLKLRSLDENIGLNTSTYRLFDGLMLWYTEHNGDAKILLNLRDYMSMCGNSDVKEARRKVKINLELLKVLCISYNETGKKSNNCNNLKLFDEALIKNSIIQVTLSTSFSEFMSKSYPMPFPLSLFRIKSDKYPNGYYILRKMAEHKNMNFGKPNENTISVKTLLGASPRLPSSEEVRSSQNHSIHRRIFLPFYRDLEYACEAVKLSDFYLTYKGDRIDDAPDGLKNFSFEDFISDIYIHLPSSWPCYPDRTIRSPQQRRTAKASVKKGE